MQSLRTSCLMILARARRDVSSGKSESDRGENRFVQWHGTILSRTPTSLNPTRERGFAREHRGIIN